MKDYPFWKKILKNKSFFQKSHTILFYLSLCLIPVILFLLSYLTGVFAEKLQPLSNPLPSFTASEYPVLQQSFVPNLTAEAAYVMDNTSKVVLYSKNPTVRFSPASTTKLMTALVALSYYKMSSTITIERSGVEPVVVGFPLDDRVTFTNMLYAMLLPSGNDCAFALADNYPGGETAFVAAMNKEAQKLHLTNTHFGDPVGLDDTDDYTTVRDLSLLASYAIQNPLIAQIVDTKEKIITDENGVPYDLLNTNILLGQDGVNGIKTGFTGEAGEVLVASDVVHNHTFITVVMKSDDRFADTQQLLQLLQNNVAFLSIKP